VFSLILPSNLNKGSFEFYCRSESLFSLLALPLDILAMCTFISLNVLETTLAVPYRIELRPCSAAMCGASCFPCHVLSPFYLSVDGLTLFNGYQRFWLTLTAEDFPVEEWIATRISIAVQTTPIRANSYREEPFAASPKKTVNDSTKGYEEVLPLILP
jgi:hypothetical protein